MRGEGAGNITATKLRHLNAHATEPLASSDGGQHGISACSTIAIWVGLAETTMVPVAGAKTTETAIKAARISRANAIRNYRAIGFERQQFGTVLT
jgi:thiazole synthase ThiGH ThiG subunit